MKAKKKLLFAMVLPLVILVVHLLNHSAHAAGGPKDNAESCMRFAKNMSATESTESRLSAYLECLWQKCLTEKDCTNVVEANFWEFTKQDRKNAKGTCKSVGLKTVLDKSCKS